MTVSINYLIKKKKKKKKKINLQNFNLKKKTQST
jgi:hypothetical protein